MNTKKELKDLENQNDEEALFMVDNFEFYPGIGMCNLFDIHNNFLEIYSDFEELRQQIIAEKLYFYVDMFKIMGWV